AEIPANAEQDQRKPELPELQARQTNDPGTHQEQQADGNHLVLAETRNQMTGQEAWRIHRNHMPGDAKRGFIGRETTADHGKWRAHHDKIHQSKRADAADDRRNEALLRHDLDERPRELLDLRCAIAAATFSWSQE